MVHDAAERGYRTGTDAYRRARPGYAAAIVDALHQSLPDGLVVELGAGTGILTAELVGRGHRIVAVEPVATMRAALAQAVPGVIGRDGRAEAIPVADGAAGAVVAAQSFHWFDAAAALDEIARILVPGGVLAVVWNVRDQSVPWVAAYTEITDEFAGDTPRYATLAWRRAIDADIRFVFDGERFADNPWPTDVDGVVDRALSTSFIAALDQDTQAEVAARIRDSVAGLGPAFDYPYRSQLHVWRRA